MTTLTNRLKRFAWLSLAGGLFFAPLEISAQALKLSEQQIRAARIATEKPQPAEAAGKQLVLNGYFASSRLGAIGVSSLERATVSEVFKDNLSDVKAGEPVLRVMSESWLRYQQEHLENSTLLKIAQQNAKRDRMLLDEGLIPQRRNLDTQAQLTMARASFESSKQRLKLMGAGDAQIKQLEASARLSSALTVLAPATGSLSLHSISPGKQIEAGAPLFQVIKPGSLELVLSAPPDQARSIRTGQSVALKDCSGQHNTVGKVIGVSQQLTEGNQSVSVRVGFAGQATKVLGCYKVNQFIQATVETASVSDKKPAWIVPNSAVVMVGPRAYVFIKTVTGFNASPVNTRPISNTHQIVQSDLLNSRSELAVTGTVLLKGTLQGLGSE